MDIYPEDFEAAYCARIQQARGLLNGTLVGGGQYGFLGAMCGMAPGIVLNLWLHIVPIVAGDFFVAGGAGAALGYVCGFFVDRSNYRKQSIKKVTAQEIILVSKTEADPLGTEYLSLISELVLMRPIQDPFQEKSIRNAICGIGSGIARLPVQPADDLLLDAGTFKAEASRLAAEATQENDAVVAASLQRQSEARNQRAEAISQNSALARRNQVLRHEMTEQIKVLKTMVSATALGDGRGVYDLEALAENIRQVAAEASAIASAHTELEVAIQAIPNPGGGAGENARRNEPQTLRH